MLSGVCAKLLAQTAEKQIPTKQKITKEAKSRTNGGVISCEPRRSCAKAGEPVTLELRTRTASQSSALQETFANFVSFCLKIPRDFTEGSEGNQDSGNPAEEPSFVNFFSFTSVTCTWVALCSRSNSETSTLVPY